MNPNILFKFRDDSQRTEEIIKNKQIWLSEPSQLNDPLECRIGEIPKDWKSKTVRQMEEAQLMGLLGGFSITEQVKPLFSMSERQTKQWFKRLRRLPHDKQVKAMRNLYSEHGMELSEPKLIFEDMRKRISKVGIFSLSESCTDELMWAHYGSSHQGIALGFNRKGDCKLANQRHCLQVKYSQEKPKFSIGFKQEIQIMTPGAQKSNVQRVSFEDSVFRSTISTKSPPWAYEKEWRYVEESSGLFDFPGTLNQVVFGINMSNDRKAFYKALLQEHIDNKVEYYQALKCVDLSGIEVQKM